MLKEKANRIDYKALMNEINLIAGSVVSIDDFLLKTFKLIGNRLKVSRVYYFDYNEQKHEISNSYEWVSKEISEQKSNLQNIDCNDIKWFYDCLIHNKSVCYEDVREIDDQATVDILLKQQIKSILAVPVYIHNQFKGFVGFDQCNYCRSFNECDELILSTLAIMCSQSIKDSRLEQALRNEHKQLLTIVDNLGGISYATEIDTYKIIHANNELKSLYNDNLEGKICYEVLQNKTKPCDFCTNKYIIDTNEAYAWDYYSPTLKRDYHLIDRLIIFPDGKKVRFEVGFDITKRQELVKKLADEKELLKVTLMSIGDGVITTDVKGKVTMMNKAAQNLLTISCEDAIGKRIGQIYNPKKESYQETCIISRAIKNDITIDNPEHSVFVNKNGVEISLSEIVSPIKSDEKVIGAVLVLRNNTEKVKRENRINYLSTHDSLTGLFNRGYCEQLMINIDKEEKLPISIIVGDVNGLKLTNDVFGHDTGDLLLKNIANIIKEACQERGIISRWGGDEFVVCLPNTTAKQTQAIVKQIKEFCNKPQSGLWSNSISLGFASKQTADEDIIETLKHAEDYMYKNKLVESRALRSEFITTMQNKLYKITAEDKQHVDRILNSSLKIAAYFNLPENEIEQLKILCKYHDVGKVAISKDILLKHHRLSKEEWKKLRRHPEIGYRIVKALPELSHVAEYVLCVRERYDGKGYPQKLAGKNIPLLARIVAVADAYDSMTHAKPYREAMSHEKAIKELRANSGKQFDPEIVWIFINKALCKRVATIN